MEGTELTELAALDTDRTDVMEMAGERVGLFEPGRKKTGLRGFRPGLTQTGLYSLRRKLES